MVPPVKPWTDRQHDPLLGRRLVGARRHKQSGAPNAIGIELLDHDPVEDGPQLVAHVLKG
jgi:hypothetical protein